MPAYAIFIVLAGIPVGIIISAITDRTPAHSCEHFALSKWNEVVSKWMSWIGSLCVLTALLVLGILTQCRYPDLFVDVRNTGALLILTSLVYLVCSIITDYMAKSRSCSTRTHSNFQIGLVVVIPSHGILTDSTAPAAS